MIDGGDRGEISFPNLCPKVDDGAQLRIALGAFTYDEIHVDKHVKSSSWSEGGRRISRDGLNESNKEYHG